MQDRSIIGERAPDPGPEQAEKPVADPARAKETGGREGPDPTRFGDWEKDGRCIDF